MIDQTQTPNGWEVTVKHVTIPDTVDIGKCSALHKVLEDTIHNLNGPVKVTTEEGYKVTLPSKQKLLGIYHVHYEGVIYLHKFK